MNRQTHCAQLWLNSGSTPAQLRLRVRSCLGNICKMTTPWCVTGECCHDATLRSAEVDGLKKDVYVCVYVCVCVCMLERLFSARDIRGRMFVFNSVVNKRSCIS